MLPLQARVDLGAMAMKGYSGFPKSFSITGTSTSDCLVSYIRTLIGGGAVWLLCREAVDVFYSPGWLSNLWLWLPTLLIYIYIYILFVLRAIEFFWKMGIWRMLFWVILDQWDQKKMWGPPKFTVYMKFPRIEPVCQVFTDKILLLIMHYLYAVKVINNLHH